MLVRIARGAVAAGICAATLIGCVADAGDVDQQEDNFTATPNLDFPEESAWARGRIEVGCDLQLDEEVEGTISETEEFVYEGYRYPPGVVYRAERDGEEIAAAWSSGTAIWRRVHCLHR